MFNRKKNTQTQNQLNLPLLTALSFLFLCSACQSNPDSGIASTDADIAKALKLYSVTQPPKEKNIPEKKIKVKQEIKTHSNIRTQIKKNPFQEEELPSFNTKEEENTSSVNLVISKPGIIIPEDKSKKKTDPIKKILASITKDEVKLSLREQLITLSELSLKKNPAEKKDLDTRLANLDTQLMKTEFDKKFTRLLKTRRFLDNGNIQAALNTMDLLSKENYKSGPFQISRMIFVKSKNTERFGMGIALKRPAFQDGESINIYAEISNFNREAKSGYNAHLKVTAKIYDPIAKEITHRLPSLTIDRNSSSPFKDLYLNYFFTLSRYHMNGKRVGDKIIIRLTIEDLNNLDKDKKAVRCEKDLEFTLKDPTR